MSWQPPGTDQLSRR